MLTGLINRTIWLSCRKEIMKQIYLKVALSVFGVLLKSIASLFMQWHGHLSHSFLKQMSSHNGCEQEKYEDMIYGHLNSLV